jgi:4-methylaminobutanoate oxidase (formaldehyde-forming)
METPLEAALSFTVAFDKQRDFNGRRALEQQRSEGVTKRLAFFKLDDPRRMLIHDEPIVRNGRIVGRVTSGAFGHSLGAAVGMGYLDIENGAAADYVREGRFEIEIATERVPATASLRPFYDPSSARMRV